MLAWSGFGGWAGELILDNAVSTHGWVALLRPGSWFLVRLSDGDG